jgi:phage shock protein A
LTREFLIQQIQQMDGDIDNQIASLEEHVEHHRKELKRMEDELAITKARLNTYKHAHAAILRRLGK